jgi:hypothetical protein
VKRGAGGTLVIKAMLKGGSDLTTLIVIITPLVKPKLSVLKIGLD